MPRSPAGWFGAATVVTGECYLVVPACRDRGPAYGRSMTSSESAADRPDAFPTPREGLDNGSLSELRIDAGEVPLDVPPPHPMTGVHHDIEVPDDASSLLEGMEAYGG